MEKKLIASFAVAIVLVAAMLIPAMAGTQQTISPEAVQILQGARVHVVASNSSNWAGYAVENASVNLTTGELYDDTDYVVTNVTGTWIVPSVTGDKKSIAYSSVWVGIDGYNSATVEQIGTEQDSIHGHGHYYAWFEMFPGPAYRIVGARVRPGDNITAGVQYSGGQFILTITDSPAKGKRGWTFSIAQDDFNTPAMRDSAEWIVEAPSLSLAANSTLPLANFGTVSFTGAQATVANVTASINSTYWNYDAITMNDGSATATPSALSPDGTSFNVTFSQS